MRRWATLLSLSCMAGSIVLAWLPWVKTGSARRNSYEAFRSAQRLGLDELSPLRVAWFLVPSFALAALVLVFAGYARLAGVVSVAVGVVVGFAGIVVTVSGSRAGIAPPASAVVGLVAVVSGVAMIVRSPEPGFG